jgi:hypothetical protein
MRSVLCAVVVAAAVSPVLAQDRAAVRQLDSKSLKLWTPGFDDAVTHQVVFRAAEDLAASTVFRDAASRAAVLGQVDFSKEKVVVLAWRGSSSSAARALISRCGKRVALAVVTSNPALADLRPHAAVFVVPLDTAVEPPVARPFDPVPIPDVWTLPSRPGADVRAGC